MLLGMTASSNECAPSTEISILRPSEQVPSASNVQQHLPARLAKYRDPLHLMQLYRCPYWNTISA